MSFLSIAGTVYPTQTPDATQGVDLNIGGVRRTFNGGKRIGVRTRYRAWSFVLAPLTEAAYLALDAATMKSAIVACIGDFSNGVSVSCTVTITDARYFKPKASGTMYRICSITIEEAGAVAIYVPPVTPVELTGIVDASDDGSELVYFATPNLAYPGDVTRTLETLTGITAPSCTGWPDPPHCEIISSVSPERIWRTVQWQAALLDGRLRVKIGSLGPTADYFPINHTQARIYIERGGVDVLGPLVTNYGAGSFFGNDLVLSTDPVNFNMLAGDRIRVEFWSQIAMASFGYTDTGARQQLFHGGFYTALLILPAYALEL